jgi:3D (Asp-Asp-Asp) domain-containing protein
VKEGRTAAVDPKVIPLGWWIYIEGYGFRRAEDKGSGVKGNWVDIYFDSHEVAENFGKQKAHVYIIGPDNPMGE